MCCGNTCDCNHEGWGHMTRLLQMKMAHYVWTEETESFFFCIFQCLRQNYIHAHTYIYGEEKYCFYFAKIKNSHGGAAIKHNSVPVQAVTDMKSHLNLFCVLTTQLFWHTLMSQRAAKKEALKRHAALRRSSAAIGGASLGHFGTFESDWRNSTQVK